MNSTPSEFSPDPHPRPDAISAIYEYVEDNPVAAIVQALAAGFVIGLIIRWIEGPKEKKGVKAVDIDHKPSLEEAKFHLGSLLLPFLWPAWQKTREKYGESAETVQEAVEKLKKSDLAKIGKKKARFAAKWADHETAFLAKASQKTKQQILDWLEQEAAELAKSGKKTAKQVEDWVDDEILPTATDGWKWLKKLWT